jgi:hypothetical protein
MIQCEMQLKAMDSEMPTLNDVYQKFGEVAEMGQLLETELGNMLLLTRGIEADLIVNANPERALDIYNRIDRLTLGQLIRSLNDETQSIDKIETTLSTALQERNRLCHAFYREHNFRRNSDEGRALMLTDLESIHDRLLQAYKAVMRLNGIDLDALVDTGGEGDMPTIHVPI